MRKIKGMTFYDKPWYNSYRYKFKGHWDDAPTVIEAEEVYGQYTDTAGNFHWCGTHSGEHKIKAEEGET